MRVARFGAVGIAATATHMAVMAALIELFALWPVAASAVAFLCALTVSYLGNYRWTFRATGPHRHHFPRYASIALAGLALNTTITFVVVDLLGAGYVVALALAVLIVPALSYTLARRELAPH